MSSTSSRAVNLDKQLQAFKKKITDNQEPS